MSLTYADGWFPFCIPSVSVWDGSTRFGGVPSGSASVDVPVCGPGTRYPLALTLEQAAELYWRIKTLAASIEVSSSNGTWSGALDYSLEWPVPHGAITWEKGGGASEWAFSSAVGSERDLVCAARSQGKALQVVPGSLGNPDADHPALGAWTSGEMDALFSIGGAAAVFQQAEMEVWASSDGPRAVTQGGSIYPRLTLWSDCDALVTASAQISSIKPAGSGVQTAAMTVLGQTLYVYWLDTSSLSLTVSGSVTASKWWTYGGIYDESTGARV